MQHGSAISVSFSNGDEFGAQATVSGQVKIYKNSTLVGTVDASGYPFYDQGGYIGLWMVNASNRLFDDFGGGTIPQGSAPSFDLAAWFAQARVWLGELFGGAKLAALMPVKILTEELQTETPPPVGQVWKNYFLVRGQRVAMREYTATSSEVYFIIGDHLGSTNIVTDVNGTVVSKLRYSAYGEERYTETQPPPTTATPGSYRR